MSDPIHLAEFNSFGVAADAARLFRIDQTDQLKNLSFDPEHDLILGGGSNVLLTENIPGRVLLVRLPGRKLERLGNGRCRVHLGAGEDWHEAVRWSIDAGLCGLENLSLIPGLCGAAPMQNIGAYGVELSSVLSQVEAWDWEQQKFVTFDSDECQLAYRDSRFKTTDPGRYLITRLTLDLREADSDSDYEPELGYQGLVAELEARNIDNPTPRDVSDAVIALRQSKLPDPDKLGNAGSFFKNPVISSSLAERLKGTFPKLPVYPSGNDDWKCSAAWLIEACGWKGFREGDAGVSAQHALVLVNYGNASGKDLLSLAERVRQSVHEQFQIWLENEPRIIRGNLSQNL